MISQSRRDSDDSLYRNALLSRQPADLNNGNTASVDHINSQPIAVHQLHANQRLALSSSNQNFSLLLRKADDTKKKLDWHDGSIGQHRKPLTRRL